MSNKEFESFSDQGNEMIQKTGQETGTMPKNAAGSGQSPAQVLGDSGDETWTDNLEEAIHRQTLREQQEYENGAEGLDDLEETAAADSL